MLHEVVAEGEVQLPLAEGGGQHLQKPLLHISNRHLHARENAVVHIVVEWTAVWSTGQYTADTEAATHSL